MTRLAITALSAVLALGAGAARAQTYGGPPAYTTGDITVYAPRNYGRGHLGGPIETVRESRAVRSWDLDLGTARGARILRERIENAARDACGDIGERYPVAIDPPEECVVIATRDAMHSVEYSLGFTPPTWRYYG
jgi:UrcA family protein